MSTLHKTGQHDRVCKMLGYALTLEDDPEAWSGLSTVLRVRLSGYERSCVLMAVVASMEPEDVEYVLEEVRSRQGIGMP